ncbi:MAG: ABC transporter ATP-binding protein [Thermoguttaceae bacterium]|nr:ABC transporter ATP-binding protein [Thermoguttaceae bacterium]
MTERNESAYAVETRGLVKSYYRGGASFNAVDGVDLRVNPGEFVAVMGASGSGKSTALHLIAGLTRATAGDVFVEGTRLSSLGDRALTIFRRRRLGIVFQSYNLIPHLTAEENILFPLRADGRKLDAERRDKLCALVRELELEDQLRQYPDSLSGGQQQRVALARALIGDPAVILADEPTGNLDWTSSRRICEIFDKLNREEGRAIILVTHEPSVAIWSSRIVVLRDGRIVSDSPRAAYDDASELAARYQELAREAAVR